MDVLVAGSGMAGCVTALCAAEMGLRTLLVEKAPSLGGTTTQSSGHMWLAANGLQAAADGQAPDTIDAGMQYLRFVGGGKHEESKMQAYVGRSAEALAYAAVLGFRFQLLDPYPDFYFPVAPGSRNGGRSVELQAFPMDELGEWKSRIVESRHTHNRPRGLTNLDLLRRGRNDPTSWDRDIIAARRREGDACGYGYGLVGALIHALLKRGVGIELNTSLDRLIEKDGRVVGAEVSGAASARIEAHAGVVLACGGYESNPFLVAQLEEMPGWRSGASRYHTGDGLVAGARLGGIVRRIVPNMQIMLGFPIEGEEVAFMSAGNTDLCRPHSIVVNREGKRFADKSFFQDVAAKLTSFDAKSHRFMHRECFWVFDDQYFQRYGLFGSKDRAALPGWVTWGDDVESVAARAGLDGQALRRTLEAYNAAAAEGEDPEFDRGTSTWSRVVAGGGTKGNPNVAPIDSPPFYVAKLAVSASASAGLLTDVDARVTRWDGEPIEGLYAVGKNAAHTHFGIGYQPGLDLGGGLVFGYAAASHLARQ